MHQHLYPWAVSLHGDGVHLDLQRHLLLHGLVQVPLAGLLLDGLVLLLGQLFLESLDPGLLGLQFLQVVVVGLFLHGLVMVVHVSNLPEVDLVVATLFRLFHCLLSGLHPLFFY